MSLLIKVTMFKKNFIIFQSVKKVNEKVGLGLLSVAETYLRHFCDQ